MAIHGAVERFSAVAQFLRLVHIRASLHNVFVMTVDVSFEVLRTATTDFKLEQCVFTQKPISRDVNVPKFKGFTYWSPCTQSFLKCCSPLYISTNWHIYLNQSIKIDTNNQFSCLTEGDTSKWKTRESGTFALVAWGKRESTSMEESVEFPWSGTVTCNGKSVTPHTTMLLFTRFCSWSVKRRTYRVFPKPPLFEVTTRTQSLNTTKAIVSRYHPHK